MSGKKTLVCLGAIGIVSAIAYLSRRKTVLPNNEKAKELYESANNVKKAYGKLTKNVEKLKNELPNSQQTIDEIASLVSEYQFKIQNNLDKISQIQEKNMK
ncbi:hypothetical protein [Liquorilactobacillus mali]|uniref:Uncharacterized protein n=1 Tax=Liquorilactobacillus mali KCTC 3596 = DSM 20444 TaxID=1046596 RepID=J1F1K3_9LACO|nr:hypothetical protein [Liquorilactobacillus mali]EJE98249.1 hypothetical protein LMA_07898 [Liquorilactobacillus mali KCTC 3596 = DSM 20444]KRN10483.1 hypothetical protein FD00_GL002439 [Liquorilactobacillus mali KCTC 3596 = DSM 20444]MDC7951849.1 hypothetical protein [Liquorilactobacillus mali]MDV7757064.1 hypothetical protein [Liquorilactobacillus mali]QFQ75097.1 hypothetical protein LM596_08165 [Liquorilactobacillus mali]